MNFFQASPSCWVNTAHITDVWVQEDTKHTQLFFSLAGDVNIRRYIEGRDKIEEFLSLTNITFDHEFY